MRAATLAHVGSPSGETARRPTVDELLQAPERVAELTPAEATRLVAQFAALTPALVLRVAERPPALAPAAHDELLKVPAAAARLSMTRADVYALIRAGVLPSVTKGVRGVRVAASAIDEWIRAQPGSQTGRAFNLGDRAGVK